MDYKTLVKEEKAGVVSAFLHAQEMEHFLHSLNIERYLKILADPELPVGEFREKIEKLLIDTEERLFEVGLIIKHTS